MDSCFIPIIFSKILPHLLECFFYRREAASEHLVGRRSINESSIRVISQFIFCFCFFSGEWGLEYLLNATLNFTGESWVLCHLSESSLNETAALIIIIYPN
ncbi:hypothetical protein EGW08_000332 [Elysia chlorotica]|uniref:Uncharacterized protein n=1 Tax=Elysia chlorotica TaxID=188477 RepID=A0A3S1BMX9_ELYCH|nr:hypothetical protein EGW08_000332 [Elysia chlorotica]